MTDADHTNDGEEQTESIPKHQLPTFARNHDKLVQYSVESESLPNGADRIRIFDKPPGSPSRPIMLDLICEAVRQGWRLDDHNDGGRELVFVPVEDGNEREVRA